MSRNGQVAMPVVMDKLSSSVWNWFVMIHPQRLSWIYLVLLHLQFVVILYQAQKALFVVKWVRWILSWCSKIIRTSSTSMAADSWGNPKTKYLSSIIRKVVWILLNVCRWKMIWRIHIYCFTTLKVWRTRPPMRVICTIISIVWYWLLCIVTCDLRMSLFKHVVQKTWTPSYWRIECQSELKGFHGKQCPC